MIYYLKMDIQTLIQTRTINTNTMKQIITKNIKENKEKTRLNKTAKMKMNRLYKE
jgi:hypothetical protein